MIINYFVNLTNRPNIALSTSINFIGEKMININITTTQEKKDLNLLIANQNLGFIKILAKNLSPTKEELLIGIKSINYDASILTINDFNIKGSINSTSAIIEGTGDYKGEITFSYRQEFDFNIWNFLDILVMGHMKNKGYWLENMKLNIKNNEILSNDKISLINLTKTFETSEQTELKNNTNIEQQLSTQEYDKEVTNTYSVTNTYMMLV